MMMKGGHAEDPLSVTELERAHLEHDAHGRGHYAAAHYQEEEEMTRIEHHRAYSAAEGHGARVAHEDLGGIAVLGKEAEQASRDGEGEHRHIRHTLGFRGEYRLAGEALGERLCEIEEYNAHREGVYEGHAGGEPVEPVRQVRRVDHSDHHEHDEGDVEPAEVDLEAECGEAHLRADESVSEHRDYRREKHLRDYLLIRAEAEIALLPDLYEIVEEAYEPEAEHHDERGNGIEEGGAVLGEQERRRDYRDDEHYPAHGGGALLGGMRVRALLALDLPVLELPQHGYKERRDEHHRRTGDDKGEYQAHVVLHISHHS